MFFFAKIIGNYYNNVINFQLDIKIYDSVCKFLVDIKKLVNLIFCHIRTSIRAIMTELEFSLD